MSASFKFIKDIFPETAEDGRRAKSYLKKDYAAYFASVRRSSEDSTQS